MQVDLVTGLGSDRARAEASLEELGLVLPLAQRALWLQARGSDDALMIVARNDGDRPVAATGVSIALSRAMPGHRLYRVERMSAAQRDDVDDALLLALMNAARRDASCLRVSIEVFERDDTRRARLSRILREHGFVGSVEMRSYERTLALELSPGADALLAGLAMKVRRNIREPAKRGLEIRRVSDLALAPRLEALLRETYERTGGVAPQLPWATVIALSEREPHRSRISGLFDPAAPGPDTLIGYTWGAVHGD
ncbi:MAG: hypothetical protein ACREMU_11895, partial [Gemmatimonadaceae bacterium]